MEATTVGTEIIIRLQSGTNVQGRFQRAGADEITLVANGAAIRVVKSDIREITTPMSRDSLKNGALIGGGIGLGVALGLLAIAASGDGYVLESAKWAAPLAGFGVGTAVGIALDAGRKQGEVLYRAR